MKRYFLFYIFALTTIVFFSCSDNDIMLYHEEPEEPEEPEPVIKWVLETINYPKDKLGLTDRGDLLLSYDEIYELNGINIPATQNEAYTIDKLAGNIISFSKKRETTTTISTDSILIHLDGNNRAMYSFHVTDNETIETGVKRRTQNDSVHYEYNSEGYLIKMQSFSTRTSTYARYTEEYTIEDGNVTGILCYASSASADISRIHYYYSYTYDDTEYVPSTKYNYEMPLNKLAMKSAGCIMVTNMIYISDYLGIANKNNVANVTIYSGGYEGDIHSNISYENVIDENGLLIETTLSGIAGWHEIPEDYTTTFTYIEYEETEE